MIKWFVIILLLLAVLVLLPSFMSPRYKQEQQRIFENNANDITLFQHQERFEQDVTQLCDSFPPGSWEHGYCTGQIIHRFHDYRRQNNNSALDCIRALPVRDPEFWNQDEIMPFANCYSYVMQDLQTALLEKKPEPGERSGKYAPLDDSTFRAAELIQRTLDDYPGRVTYISPDTLHQTVKQGQMYTCPCGSYLICLLADYGSKSKGQMLQKLGLELPHNNQHGWDFHWLRQDRTGFWSHKRGSGAATVLDAQQKVIVHPVEANFDYTLNGQEPRNNHYSHIVAYFCVQAPEIDFIQQQVAFYQ